MKFVVSSSSLLSLLQTVGKVISSKNSLPILDNFLLELAGDTLKVTASDLETTLVGSLKVDKVEKEGSVAAPAKLMLDSLKEFSEQPLTLEVNAATSEIKMIWKSGSLALPGTPAIGYPTLPELSEEKQQIDFEPDTLLTGINKCIFATADDELRPVMNGVYINIEPGSATFVATDAHKLVRHTTQEGGGEAASAFILPKKPANLLRSVLHREQEPIKVSFDKKNAMFALSNSLLICRLIEGNYPNYNAVIPANNPNHVLVDRAELLNCIRRVAVCSNPATNLIRLEIKANQIDLTAQDLDNSVSANEALACSYEGDRIEIGFKSTFLVEILSNIETPSVMVELADSTRAGVFKPVYDDKQTSDTLMLLMPMMING